jgi:hypothetical protein
MPLGKRPHATCFWAASSFSTRKFAGDTLDRVRGAGINHNVFNRLRQVYSVYTANMEEIFSKSEVLLRMNPAATSPIAYYMC